MLVFITLLPIYRHYSSQADKERAERQREYMAQLEREASYDSSEPTSITNSSTQEGELTIQHEDKEDEVGEAKENNAEEEEEDEDRTLATTPEGELDRRQQEEQLSEFSTSDMMLLRQKLEEVRKQNPLFGSCF